MVLEWVSEDKMRSTCCKAGERHASRHICSLLVARVPGLYSGAVRFKQRLHQFVVAAEWWWPLLSRDKSLRTASSTSVWRWSGFPEAHCVNCCAGHHLCCTAAIDFVFKPKSRSSRAKQPITIPGNIIHLLCSMLCQSVLQAPTRLSYSLSPALPEPSKHQQCCVYRCVAGSNEIVFEPKSRSSRAKQPSQGSSIRLLGRNYTSLCVYVCCRLH
jgi:hypothetical protein